MTSQEKLNLVTNYFAEDWAIEKAMQLLEDYESSIHNVLEDAASAGFFLQLPQRPRPEAPAGTVGLDWDAYSGAQMLAYGRDCSNAAIVATQKPGGL